MCRTEVTLVAGQMSLVVRWAGLGRARYARGDRLGGDVTAANPELFRTINIIILRPSIS